MKKNTYKLYYTDKDGKNFLEKIKEFKKLLERIEEIKSLYGEKSVTGWTYNLK